MTRKEAEPILDFIVLEHDKTGVMRRNLQFC